MQSLHRVLRAVLAWILLLCVLLFVIWSRHWPLVGDASLIHYICFLMDHGMAPYRDLGDMNMPGVYIIEWVVMHTFGGGDLAWRLFDFTLMAAAAAAIFAITLPYDWFAGCFAAGLLILVHGRDGLGQAGQRDLTMAICLLISIAFLFHGVRRNRSWPFALFGFFSGVAATIKPTILPFGVVLLLLALITLRRRGKAAYGPAWSASAGLTIGPAVALLFLLKWHAAEAFLEGLSGIVPYYASLGHRPFGFLLLHSISPLLPVVLLWLLLAVVRPHLSWERLALLCGIGFGLISYIVQARGYPYYRYPLLVFLLPLMAIDFTSALRLRSAARVIAFSGLIVGSVIIAPTSIFLIHQYETHADFITSLEESLDRLGGPELSGHIQCIDSISGCGSTLYRMRLVQSTGVLSDFLLFGPETTPVVRTTREQFRRAFARNPPRVIVVSSWLHIDGPGDYRKLARWPEFAEYLSTEYLLKTEWTPGRPNHWWSRKQSPDGYRIYVLKD
ncbi:glycosyltransferase family 39 protein [Edaphobacter modestus]|uniref:Dolichyl-phosphate-mannose-protein mannosyltransferase n=1 Tax=Edaphobacter modestus TaxID=388466 RepID=A0A4Q7YXX6_9BACT|nr:glycosyltransferase family 39 protein [Edaphobacter modestus]RZU42727.1 dolichyl-phosphate-mannose-protein mannosyltransferase [Edaphobacter modestus]